MLVLVGVMTYTTLVFLLRGSAATGATTYSQLTRQLCGPAVMKVGTGCGQHSSRPGNGQQPARGQSIPETKQLQTSGGSLRHTSCPPPHQAAIAAAAAACHLLFPSSPGVQVLQLAVLSFCFGFGVVYLVIIRDILLGTPPACNGLLCELFGLPPSSVLADPRLVIVALALLVCSPLLLLR